MDYIITHRTHFEKMLELTYHETESLSQAALICLFGLCDPFIGMAEYSPSNSPTTALVNNLPPSDILQLAAHSLLQQLNQGSYSTVALRLRIVWTMVDNHLGCEAVKVSIQGGEYKGVLGRLCEDSSVSEEHDQCSSLLLDLLHRLTAQREGEQAGLDMSQSLLAPDGVQMLEQLSMLLGRNRPNQEILLSDRLTTSHVT